MELDISDNKSIDNFANHFLKSKRAVDILINNAGIASKGDAINEQIARQTFQTNVYGTIHLTKLMIPYIKEHGKIITIGSSTGKLIKVTSAALKEQLTSEALTEE